jgi:hypothetical protein
MQQKADFESEYPRPLANLQTLFDSEYVVKGSPEHEGRRKIPRDSFFQAIPCLDGILIWP